MVRYGVQLYTVREACQRDFLGTLEEVARLGYEGVEFAGFYDVTAEVLKAHLEKLGLTPIASHETIEQLNTQLEAIVQYNKAIGNTKIVCSYAKVEDEDGLKQLQQQLLAIGTRLKAEGITFLYHNHDQEFEKIGEVTVLDSLLKHTEGIMQSELDSFWAYRAGVDPVAYMQTLGDKLQLIHLKDGTLDCLKALGEGDAPIKAVHQQAEKMGIEWLIVENDEPYPTGLEDIARSMQYLKG